MNQPKPLRLLLFLDTDVLSGPARLALDFAVEACRLGHEVLILGLVRGSQPEPTPFERAMADAEIPTRRLHERFRFDPGIIGQFERILEEFKPDVYQSHGYKGSLLGRIAQRRGVRWQAVFHGFTWENWTVRFYHALDVRWLRRADEVIVVAPRFSRELARRGVSEERLRWVPNAISETHLRAARSGTDLRQEWGDAMEDGVIIGMMGRFSPEKAPDRFLRVFDAASRRHPGLRGVMIGDGPLVESCRRLARTLRCGDNVIFAGFRTDLASVYDALDILVIPSRSEGMPTVMLEAMTMGVPVIATDVGAVADVACDGQTALIVPEDDEAALVEAIVRLAGDGALRRRLAEAAQQMVRQRLSVQARTQTVLEHARCLCEAAPLPDFK